MNNMQQHAFFLLGPNLLDTGLANTWDSLLLRKKWFKGTEIGGHRRDFWYKWDNGKSTRFGIKRFSCSSNYTTN